MRVKYKADDEGENGYRQADGKWRCGARVGWEIGKGMDEDDEDSVGHRRT